MKKTAFFTMDVEVLSDTSCLKNNPDFKDTDVLLGLKNYAELLKKYNIPATFFLTSNAVGAWEDEIRKLAAEGNELAVHSLEHEPVLGYDRDKFVSTVKSEASLIESRFGVKPEGYRAPCFGINDGIAVWLKETGMKYDSSALNYKKASRSGYLDLDGFKQINAITFEKEGFYEIKPPVTNFFFGEIPVCGGGYMRLAPAACAERAVKKYLKKSDAFLFYVHPFELYTGKIDLPKNLSFGNRMYINRGRKSYADRIERLIKILIEEGYEFSSIKNYIDGIENRI